MLKKFFPDECAQSAYTIDYKKLYEQGYRGILFDIDNTLVEHGMDATRRAEELFDTLRSIGFTTCLISNNKLERVHRFNKDIRTNYIENAHKPSKASYIKAMELMDTNLSNTVFIGDQLFTDVYGAKRLGMKNILVQPIDSKEEIQIVFKRYLERIVLRAYRKQLKKGDSKHS